MKKNDLAIKSKCTTSSYLYGKNYTYKKLYCKLNNIDTVIMDKFYYFNINNIYNNNKYLKNIIIDLNNPENYINIDLNNETTIENISYLNYPLLEGITIPLDILNERLGLKIFVAPNRTNIKKINILNKDKIEVINIDEFVSYYRIETIIKNGEKEIRINIGYINDDKKTIYYDKLGNKTITHNIQTINSEKNIDLRDYKNTKLIKYSEYEYHDSTSEFIITPSILKEKQLENFKNVNINKFILMSDNEMEFNPIKLELFNVTLDIFNIDNRWNILYVMDNNYNEYHIYIDENNKLNIIDSNKLETNSTIEKYKYLQNNNISGVIVKYKKDLKFDLYINNKKYHLNKMYVNWCLHNIILFQECILPSGYRDNIYDMNKDDYETISSHIYDNLLEKIISHELFNKFDREYNSYLTYLDNINLLHNMGYSNKALIYLHQNNFDNITCVGKKYKQIDDIELINSINEISKKLIKRK